MSRRLLIVDPMATNRIALKAALLAALYDVACAETGAGALERIGAESFDLVLAAGQLPDMTGAGLCRHLRDGDDDPPPVLLLDDAPCAATALDALEAGAEARLCRPLRADWLLAHIRSILRARDVKAELRRRDATACQLGFADDAAPFAAAGRVILIGPADRAATDLCDALAAGTGHRVAIMPEREALSMDPATAAAPDLFVLPVPARNAADRLSLLSELRSRQASRHAAVIVLHAGGNRESGARALDLGANDLAVEGCPASELAARIARQLARKRDEDRLRATVDAGLRLAATDPLTGLYNRRFALHHLSDLARGTWASGGGYGVMIVDIDHFKSVNDTHGHIAGDAVLTQVAHRLRDDLRGADLMARIGGEEFLVALPTTTADEAATMAERLRALVADTPLPLAGADPVPVTVSIGAAVGQGPAAQVIEAADRALYAAKSAGRNRVRTAPFPLPEAPCSAPSAGTRHSRTAGTWPESGSPAPSGPPHDQLPRGA